MTTAQTSTAAAARMNAWGREATGIPPIECPS
jgi:hypothetical protein